VAALVATQSRKPAVKWEKSQSRVAAAPFSHRLFSPRGASVPHFFCRQRAAQFPYLGHAGYLSFPQVLFSFRFPLAPDTTGLWVRRFLSLTPRVQRAAEALFDNFRTRSVAASRRAPLLTYWFHRTYMVCMTSMICMTNICMTCMTSMTGYTAKTAVFVS